MPPTPPPAKDPPAQAPERAEPRKPAAPRERLRAVQRRFRREPRYDDLPRFDENTTPWFIETGPPRRLYQDPHAEPRPTRAMRREAAQARFARFRARPWSSWLEDPGFFWQLALTLALLLALALCAYLAWAHPPVRFH